VNLLGGLTHGIALLGLLETLDLARRLDQATIGGVIRARLLAWGASAWAPPRWR
jgi:hypothetical protein